MFSYFKKFLFYLISHGLFVSCNFIKEKTFDVTLPKSSSKTGIGLIHFNLSEPIKFFKTETDSIPYDTLKFSETAFGLYKGTCEFKTGQLGSKLKPYILFQGDSDSEAENNLRMGLIRFAPELVFRVVKATKNGFIVVIDESTLETSYIKVDFKNDLRKNTNSNPNFFEPNFVDSKISNWFYYETWPQILKRAYEISIDTAKIYHSPNGRKISTDREYARIDSVTGDWARLIEGFNEDSKKIGWIKWHENDSIKVGIVLNGGYE
ncbi:hypothetical protein [Flavobacterium sp. H122]|uniref:hypothetical protein n=1 Tax=Flavobacterium sp. H122 TaxID=2529860 RepID=UPI0010A9DC3A|nr:hypothetical protein [Flavobacterium sp. H122]